MLTLRVAAMGIALALSAGGALYSGTAQPADRQTALVELGRQLFHDPALSRTRTQSCATCHDPEHAFTDPRPGEAGRSVSIGADGSSHGDRNTPMLTYAALSPAFHQDDTGRYKGGQFWDGRAKDLTDQAGQPMLNPVEMAMADKASIAERLAENPTYVGLFQQLFDDADLGDPDATFQRTAEALAAFQSSPEFSTFDSKYDRWQRGEEKLTAQEEFGYTVFITWNCRLCHQVKKQGVTELEPFTNFEFHNIGIPVNDNARAANGKAGHVDRGLAEATNDPAQAGKFKVPSLRNVAVTGPYMHNGVFEDLRTAVAFYNRYTSRRPSAMINPETGEAWGDPEVAENISLPELRSGLEVNDERIDALVAFLETLTDRRYEPLMLERRAEREARIAERTDGQR